MGRGGDAMYPKPTVYRVPPERSCHYETVKGPQPKRMLVPAAPGLTATALTSHTISLSWTLAAVPSKCRSRFLLLSIVAYEQGWLVRREHDPRMSPVWLAGRGFCFLNTDGSITEVEEEVA